LNHLTENCHTAQKSNEMKNLMFAFLCILTIGAFSSCDKSDNDNLSDEALAEEIAASSAKQNIELDELPATTKAFIDDEHFDTYVESAAYVNGLGYEVTLGTEDVEYFSVDGDVLRHRDRPHQCYRPGPCGGGQVIGLDQIPPVITEYITENYPDAVIRRAKTRGSFYLVAITGPTILVFTEDGAFVNDFPLFRFCFGHRIDLVDLPEVIVNYINENYPNVEIKVAFRARGKIIVGVLKPDGTRAIIVFTQDGVFIFDRP
jgi:hypothetical protein